MYIPNDNCNTCLITMTTIGKMSGLIFRKVFISFVTFLFSVSLFPFHVTNFVLNLSHILSSFLLKNMTTRNSLIKSKSTITKAGNFAGAKIHRYLHLQKTPTLKDIVMLQDLQTPLKYSCINHKFY